MYWFSKRFINAFLNRFLIFPLPYDFFKKTFFQKQYPKYSRILLFVNQMKKVSVVDTRNYRNLSILAIYEPSKKLQNLKRQIQDNA